MLELSLYLITPKWRICFRYLWSYSIAAYEVPEFLNFFQMSYKFKEELLSLFYTWTLRYRNTRFSKREISKIYKMLADFFPDIFFSDTLLWVI